MYKKYFIIVIIFLKGYEKLWQIRVSKTATQIQVLSAIIIRTYQCVDRLCHISRTTSKAIVWINLISSEVIEQPLSIVFEIDSEFSYVDPINNDMINLFMSVIIKVRLIQFLLHYNEFRNSSIKSIDMEID